MSKTEYKKLAELLERKRRRIREINRKRHQLIHERKHRGYTKLLGLKMNDLGIEREKVYREIYSIRRQMTKLEKETKND